MAGRAPPLPPFPRVLRGVRGDPGTLREVLGCGRSCQGCHPRGDTVICCDTEQIPLLAPGAGQGWAQGWELGQESALLPAGWSRGTGNLLGCPELPDLLFLPAPSRREGMEDGAWHLSGIVLALILICGEE